MIFLNRKSALYFLFNTDDVLYSGHSSFPNLVLNHKNMIRITIYLSEGERLETQSEKAPHKKILVRGHFRNVNNKRTYVKSHYRINKR